jgi:hypothetical protein
VSSGFASDADHDAWIRAGSPELPRPGEVRREQYPAGEAPWFEIDSLPKDPGRLLAALRSGELIEHRPGDDQVFLLIGELLAQGDASPQVRSALFEVAARLDGVDLVGEVVDPRGRRGEGMALDGASSRTQLVFDPETARLLAIELYSTPGDRLSSWSTFEPPTVVNSPPQPVS